MSNELCTMDHKVSSYMLFKHVLLINGKKPSLVDTAVFYFKTPTLEDLLARMVTCSQ